MCGALLPAENKIAQMFEAQPALSTTIRPFRCGTQNLAFTSGSSVVLTCLVSSDSCERAKTGGASLCNVGYFRAGRTSSDSTILP